MPIRVDGIAPYAPAQSIIDLISRYRNRGLSTPITGDVLERAGIKETLSQRVLQSLKLLDLIDDSGNPTSAFVELGKAPQDEYQSRLAEVIRSAYSEVFKFVDPSQDSTEKVRDAFRGFNPRPQQERMVTLFLALCEAAGIVDARPKATRTAVTRTIPKRAPLTRPDRKTRDGASRQSESDEGIPPSLLGLLRVLPQDGWTKEQRDRFVRAFEGALDYSILVRPETSAEVPTDDQNGN